MQNISGSDSVGQHVSFDFDFLPVRVDLAGKYCSDLGGGLIGRLAARAKPDEYDRLVHAAATVEARPAPFRLPSDAFPGQILFWRGRDSCSEVYVYALSTNLRELRRTEGQKSIRSDGPKVLRNRLGRDRATVLLAESPVAEDTAKLEQVAIMIR